MAPEQQDKVGQLLREAAANQRGYADFFDWPDRDAAEAGVLESLQESMKMDKGDFMVRAKIRGRGEDPPDLEATDSNGQRVAVEITELVDGATIKAVKKGDLYAYAEWPCETFVSRLGELLQRKDARRPDLKGTPYPGGYVVVVSCDEAALTQEVVASYLTHQQFGPLPNIDRAFLLLSYDPRTGRCPYFELATFGSL